MASSAPEASRAFTAFQPMAASHVHWARNMPSNTAGGMFPWSESSSPKKARKSRWCSALSSVDPLGQERLLLRRSGRRSPLRRTVCTISRGTLTPTMRMPLSRAKTKMSR